MKKAKKKIGKRIKVISAIAILLVAVFLIAMVTSYDNSFTITEHTDYDIGSNTVYLTIKENLGKNQIINISSIFGNNPLTANLTYGDIYMNLSYPYPIYEDTNVSLGKYSTSNTSTINGTTQVTNYYASNGSQLFCDFVLGDKSCIVVKSTNTHNETRYDYQLIPSQKSKITIGGLNVEFKNGGIPIAKNSTIQLRYSYNHPLAVPANVPNTTTNKYSIEVCSQDGVDCSLLDPTWWDSSWTRYKEVNVTGGVSDLSNFTVYINVTYDSDMKVDFSDVRWINASGSQMFYDKDFIINSSSAGFWVKFSVLKTGTNTIYMYYGNPSASSTANGNAVWTSRAYHASETSGSSMLDSYSGLNLTTSGSPILNQSGAFGYALQCDGSAVYAVNATSIGDLVYGAGVRTIGFWVYRFTTQTDKYMFGYGDQNTGTKYFSPRWTPTTGTLGFMGNGASSDYDTGVTLNNGQWYYLTYQYNGTSMIIGYNGQLSQAAKTLNTAQNVHPLYLCRRTAGDYYNGLIDEIRFTNTTLSSAEINRTYQNRNMSNFLFGDEVVGGGVNVTLINPANAATINDSSTVYFGANFTALSSTAGIANSTLYIWNASDNSTYTTSYATGSGHSIIRNQSILMDNGDFIWNYLVYENETNTTSWGTNRSFIVNVTTPILAGVMTLISPIDNALLNYSNITFDYTFDISNGNYTNSSLFIWNSSNSIIYKNLTINCYQETSNSSTSCGGLNTGNYETVNVANMLNNSYWIDGNWNTYGLSASNPSGYNINYTKPANAERQSTLWQVKDENGIVNLTIPANCWNSYNDTLKLSVRSSQLISTYVNWECWNSVDNNFTVLRNESSIFQVYEEAIIWKGNNTINITPDGIYKWNAYGCGENSTDYLCAFASSNYTFTIDTISPNISILYPQSTIPTLLIGQNITLNYSASDTNLQACWFGYGGINTTLVCGVNSSFLYDGANKTVYLYANDTIGHLSNTSVTMSPLYSINAVTYNSTVYETNKEGFTLVVNTNTTQFTSRSAGLYYNGTLYPTASSNVGDNVTFNNSINIPAYTGNQSFFWQIGLTNSTATYYFNTSSYNQTLQQIDFALCNATLTVPYLNLTFHNETTAGEVVNATITTSTFVYSLASDFGTNLTYTYSNATQNPQYSFCFIPSNQTVYVFPQVTYDNAESSPRTFVNESMMLTNSTTVQDLLLLPGGSLISFIIQNQYLTRLENALITITKTSDGSSVAQAFTDGTGIASFWLDTSTNYHITVSKSGYDDYSTSITPSTTPVTYTLSQTSSGGGGGVQGGISYSLTPSSNKLQNGTTYTFGFNISSSSKTLDEYGFGLWNSTTLLYPYQIEDGDSDGSQLTIDLNTGNQSYIILRWYYVVDGSYTNGSKQYFVVNTAGTGTSIANLLTDIGDAIDNSTNGLFGVKKGTSNGDFTLAIIVFIITFFIAGMMTYKYGITSTSATMFAIFAIMLFFDVGAGLVPNPISAVPHSLTIILGIITAIFFVRETII